MNNSSCNSTSRLQSSKSMVCACSSRAESKFPFLQDRNFRAGNPAERRFIGGGASVAAVHDPFQHAHVFAEARPKIFAFFIFAKPVHVKNARRMLDQLCACSASAGNSRPCCSRRKAASPSDRGAPVRPCLRRRPWFRSPSSPRR